MKTFLQLTTTLTLFFLIFYNTAAAQVRRPTPNDCYAAYVKKGDEYKNLRNYDLAIQQYQAARYCGNLSTSQRTTLDTLIAETTRLKNRIIRRY